MNKSVLKYMVIDLLVLTVIGCILEGLVSRFIGFLLDAAPTITFSLLIVFIAIARWKLWGLVPIPFLVMSTILGGHFSEISYYAAFYSFSNWQLIRSMMIGLLAIGLNIILFRNHKTNKILKSPWKMLLILVADYIIYCVIQFVFYRLFTTGNLTSVANIPFIYYTKDESGNSVENMKNLANYVEYGFMYNLFGLAVGVVGSLVLRSQGAFSDESEEKTQNDESNKIEEKQDSSE